MPSRNEDDPTIAISLRGREDAKPSPPGILRTDYRSAAAGTDPFVNDAVVTVRASYDLSARHRGAGEEKTAAPEADQLVALEAEDGTTLFIRADKLEEDLRRLYPEEMKEGGIDLDVLAGREASSRGLGDWLWSRFSVLDLGRDAIIERAEEKARELVAEWLEGELKDAAEKAGVLSVSWLGAKALMWAIESQLAGAQGLYRWRGKELETADRIDPGAPGLEEAARKGMLVFVHGTASHTMGAFKDLGAAGKTRDWEALEALFPGGLYGFEHRTFSESPIDNALLLAETLPEGARISLVTHSRGGIVGDLLCIGELDEEAIAAYRRDPPLREKEEKKWEKAIRELVAKKEQEKLRRLVSLLREKKFRIERYLRVACPAGGTRLLSDNLDVFLSGLLSLTNALVGAVAGPGASPVLSAFKRIVLEIAHKRMDPWTVPGIEAMLIDSPMARLLARAAPKPEVAMGVIAGDVEGGGMLQRLGVMFTDWMFFDRTDNDLVVDTSSMYAGLAARPEARFLFDQGEKVNHFNYFENRRTRRGLQDWLSTEPGKLPQLEDWSDIALLREPDAEEAKRRRISRGAPPPDNTRPVVVLLPGIMGSHLEVGGTKDAGRVWFNPLALALGGLDRIRTGAPGVSAEDLFEMFYGGLAGYLEATHRVVRFPYDWRRPVQEAAASLAGVVADALDRHPDQPVRLLAHSMGGLVVRAMIAADPKLWDRVVERAGGRFVMLGTPNNGSHLMVETLLGKAGSIRKLAVMDVRHDIRELLAIVAGFPGAVQLLPRPGFRDAGGAQADDYYERTPWENFRQANRDRWFGDGICGLPEDRVMQETRALWEGGVTEIRGSGEGFRHRPIQPVDRVAYVFGQAENTPCGIRVEKGRLVMVGTTEGDGTVSWASGRLDFLPDERCWHMPADHGSLMKTEEHFPAILDLLETGVTSRLGRLPVTRGVAATRSYDAGPVTYPTPEEVGHSFMGTRPVRRPSIPSKRVLRVRVRAMDLRHCQVPVMCGHYIGDPIAGAESQIDRHLVGGKLRYRERLGVYAGDLGTAALVLGRDHRTGRDDVVGKGAVVVGLGEWGKLTGADVSETVRAGVLRFLLLAADRMRGGGGGRPPQSEPLRLATVLIGYNSTVNIGVEDSVAAVVRGVCEANRQFEDTVGSWPCIGELEFVELYEDTAITAAHAVRDLERRLRRDLKRLETEIDAAKTLEQGHGCRTRLSVSSAAGYWPRMIVTDADRPEPGCPPECYRVRKISPVPPGMEEALAEDLCGESGPADTQGGDGKKKPKKVSAAHTAERMKFVYLSERARAEAIVAQRQPGLAEKLVRQAVGSDRYREALSRTLFQLLVPLDFKEAARDADRMLLVLDGATANLPWEMLSGGDEPMVVKTAVVRQLESVRFRKTVRTTRGKTACIIAAPLTRGFEEAFVTASGKGLPQLPGAVEEGDRVREILTGSGYDVVFAPSESEALDVFNKLFQAPHRILVIAAHGVYEAESREGGKRTGVVLSDGMLLTAAEVGQMEIVPEVVFLNCCHLGQVDAVPPANRLAYSLSRELIEMGVRCVVAAGWAVNDRAAVTFAGAFFEHLVRRGEPFGIAVHEARRETHRAHREYNTWGAYQAYGDPGFVLERDRSGAGEADRRFVACQELLEELGRIRNEVRGKSSLEQTRGEVDRALSRGPEDWKRMPAVLSAVASVYAEFGTDGFEAARDAYLKAVGEEDKVGRVPIRAIEQLANLEARTGAAHPDPREGLKLVRQAIARLEKLFLTTSEAPGRGFAFRKDPQARRWTERPNLERWALLGSALKRRAALEVETNAARQAVRKTLEEARDAYAMCEGRVDDPALNPYAMINRIQIEALLGAEDRPGRADLARELKAISQKRFEDSLDFFDAMMEVDAHVAEGLHRGTIGDLRDVLEAALKAVFDKVPGSERERDSVRRQLALLATFSRKLGEEEGDDGRKAELSGFADTMESLAAAVTHSGSGKTAVEKKDEPAAAKTKPGPKRAAKKKGRKKS